MLEYLTYQSSASAHYDSMKPRYGNRLKVCYKDSDSLQYCMEREDLYEEIKGFKHLLDLSDYHESHFLHDKSNKKIPLKEGFSMKLCVYDPSCIAISSKGVKPSAKRVQKNVKKTLHHDLFD